MSSSTGVTSCRTAASSTPGTRRGVKEQSILSYLYAHSAEKLTLSQVAEAFFLSESALSKQISGMTGTSFSKLLSSIRVEKASDYLIYTDLTLDEIAKLCGFVDASHVSKHFAQRVGVTPMQYRKIYSKAVTKFNISDKAVAFALTDYIYKNYETERLSAASVAAGVQRVRTGNEPPAALIITR